jgi:hypothetical protein
VSNAFAVLGVHHTVELTFANARLGRYLWIIFTNLAEPVYLEAVSATSCMPDRLPRGLDGGTSARETGTHQ